MKIFRLALHSLSSPGRKFETFLSQVSCVPGTTGLFHMLGSGTIFSISSCLLSLFYRNIWEGKDSIMQPPILPSPEAHASKESSPPRHCSLLREKVIESSGRRDIPARDEVSLNEGLWEGGEHTRFISVA